MDEDVDPIDFVHWLLSLKAGEEASAWRTDRNGARAFLFGLPHGNRDRALAILTADINRRDYRPKHAVYIWKHDFDCLIGALPVLAGGEIGLWIADIATTLLATGLEPQELATTFVETREDPSGYCGRRAWLHVAMVAFAQDVHSRTIEITGLNADTITIVERTINRCASWAREDKFDARLKECTRELGRVCGLLFGRTRRRYTLLSLRDQFAANILA